MHATIDRDARFGVAQLRATIAQGDPMFDVYELYGSRSENIQDALSLVSNALGLVFEYHESYYLGAYFMAMGLSDRKLTIESNQLEDEEGIFFQETEFSDCKTLVRLEYSAPSHVGDGPVPDEISRRLRSLGGLTFLKRDIMPA
jgi:hypothetical protein